MREQTQLGTALEAKLETAERVLSLSNRNVELAMQMWIEAAPKNEDLLARRAENSAQIAELIEQLKAEAQSDEERELLEAVSPRASLASDYGELLHQIIDGQSHTDGAAAANVMLPLLLDNSSWKAFVECVRAQLRVAQLFEPDEEAMTRRARALVRENQVLKSIVAERKRLEERLSQLASIIECANDAIVIYTLGGTIVSWNTGAEDLYGYPAREVLGRSRYTLISPNEPDQVPRILERLKRKSKIEVFEAVHLRKGGKRMSVSMSVSPVKDVGGNIVGFAAITRRSSSRRSASPSGAKGRSWPKRRVLPRI